MTQGYTVESKCFKRKYIFFGEKVLKHKFEIQKIWQRKRGTDFCFNAKCKRCALTQTWWDIPMDSLIYYWNIDESILVDLAVKYPSEYFHTPISNNHNP